LLLLLGPKLLPEFKDPKAGRIDILSALLSLACILSIIFGLKKIAEDGFELLYGLYLLGGAILGYIFIQRQKKLTHPLVDLRLFTGKSTFGSLLSMNLLSVFTTFGCYIFISQFLQLVLGLTPLVAGLWTLPWSVGFIVGSMYTPKLTVHFKPTSIMATGLIAAAVGFVILAQADTWRLVAIVSSSILFSVGLAPLFTLITDLILSAVPPERAGAAGALSETSSELGGALGIAVLGSIGTAIYRINMGNADLSIVPQAEIPVVKSTLGGAIAVAEKMPAQSGNALAEISKVAFTDSLTFMAYLSAVLSIVLACLVFYKFRNQTSATARD
jgi:MFS transporter, DHA2 family, multidrug resistance protein